MTRVRAALADYLRIRRRLGFEMPQDGRLLEGFVDFLEQAGAERITTECGQTTCTTTSHLSHPRCAISSIPIRRNPASRSFLAP